MIARKVSKSGDAGRLSYDRFVLLFAVWWLFDMVFVWISPRSYEQYYLPLNASGAMLGGYLIAICYDRARTAASRPKWVGIGVFGLLLMVAMAWPTFGGVTKSPHSGRIYANRRTGLPEKQRGYVQKLKEIRLGQNRGAWEDVGQYIRENSALSDVIYVWGWFPGIYVQARRLSPAPKAFEGTMHTLAPEVLSERVDELLSSFEKQPPRFIVDTYKSHFPWDRPPLELWPRTQKGFLPVQEQIVSQYEAEYAKMLRDKIRDADEVKRFQAMKPFRDYVMKSYQVVRTFTNHVLYQRK
ncbi:MAG: hypothetical protein ACYTEK_13240 [Planctomycetota bacterium]|jgi:hypothetical protein